MESGAVLTAICLVAFSLTFGFTAGDIFDVTTVYDISDVPDTNYEPITIPITLTGRVHARTNAEGLLLNTPQEKLASVSAKVNNLSCDTVFHGCNWDRKGWTGDIIPGNYFYMIENHAYPIWNQFTLKGSGNVQSQLFLTTTPSNVRDEKKFHLMELTTNSYVKFYSDCTASLEKHITPSYRYQFTMSDRDGTQIYCGCEDMPSYFQFSFLGLYHLRISIDGTSILFYTYKSLQSSYSSSISINYISTSGGSLYLNNAVLSTSKIDSELVSPKMNLQSKLNRIYLDLIFYYDEPIQSDQLHILTEEETGDRHLVGTVHDAEVGWNILHTRINETLPTQQIKLVVKMVGTKTVKICYISVYESEGENIEILQPTLMRTSPTYYTISKHLLLPEPYQLRIGKMQESCRNGGVMTLAGCACPPGFAGDLCESGCGRNRFGQDCGGFCSVYNSECQALLLCSPVYGCRCAPGYTGPICKERCSPGKYGNSCAQSCGHCLYGKPCDIYTGECAECDVGYLNPHCSDAYVYYSLKPSLTSDDYGKITVTFNPNNGTSGYGKPHIYQIQYREEGHEWKTYVSKIVPTEDKSGLTKLKDEVAETIEGLRNGVFYEVRVLFMDTNLNKYDGDLVEVAKIVTKCDIPEQVDYNIETATNTTSLTFSWTYNYRSGNWCPLENYEVSWKGNGIWLTNNTPKTSLTLTDLFPGVTVDFKMRANTSAGYAPLSVKVPATTQHNGSSSVRGLSVVSYQSTSVNISWLAPVTSEGRQLRYMVSYKCVNRMACPPGCQDAIEGQLTQEDTRITLSSLLPFSQYLISVTPENGLLRSIYVQTSEAVPTEIPSLSAQRPTRTNTSLTVFWAPATVCSSYLNGYNYQLLKESNSMTVLVSGFTRDTSASFHNLTASTQYIVRVYVVTIVGYNPQAYLTINTSTSATVPEAVRDLTVYKRGRNMLGLRWAAPRATYGPLKSFTVTHSLGKDATSHTVQPTPCTAWPSLFCNTIHNLRPNRRYNVTVSARNIDVAEEGLGASVVGLTKEASPTAPENLRLINSSSTSVGLRWNHPNFSNGIIRSFLVSVEETEKFDQDSCCQVYPFVEIPVTEEKTSYDVEVSGLHPSSTYFVSVSAKTVGLGPSQSLVVVTRPPHLPVSILPPTELQGRVYGLSTYIGFQDDMWLPQERQPEVNNSNVYSSLIKAHLLFLVFPSDSNNLNNESGVLDPKLDSILQSVTSEKFFFFKEYYQGAYTEESDWGSTLDCSNVNSGEESQLVAVQVTEYGGSYNVDIRYYNDTITYDDLVTRLCI